MRKGSPELFIGLAGAVGTDLDLTFESLAQILHGFGYGTSKIHLAGCLRETSKKFQSIPNAPLDDYINQMMTAGDEFRRDSKRDDIVALLGIAKIQAERQRLPVDASEHEMKLPGRHAFVLKSLKHPEEVRTLRQIYGSNFYLLAAYSPKEQRLKKLAERIAADHHRPVNPDDDSARSVIERDQKEPGKSYGQNLQDTFHLADCFIDASEPDSARRDIQRFVELAFGHPFSTPTRAEYVMFHAQAAALRSSEPGRQVGAAIADADGNIVAVGSNEVPKAGGGLAWCDDRPDYREHTHQVDTSDAYKLKLLEEVLQSLRDAGWLNQKYCSASPWDLVQQAIGGEKPPLSKKLLVRNVIEYGRAVHAEMAAIDDAARRGVAAAGCTMYVTTYPCHLCARHIIAAGIRDVRYIEPYPRSLAADFYPDSIVDEPFGTAEPQKAGFSPFLGIAPSQYLRLFKAPKRKDDSGGLIRFDPQHAEPRGIAPEPLYLDREDAAVIKLDQAKLEM